MTTDVTSAPALRPEEERVFAELRIRKAMPILEIAGVTGIYGTHLQNVISQLANRNLITIQGKTSPLDGIVTISGRYF